MARPYVFSAPTKLWNIAEGWKLFPAGETDPGGAWHDREGGDPVGSATHAGIMADLIEANDRLDKMGQTLASKDHDVAQMAEAKEAAEAQLADLEQRAIAAEKAQAQAEAAAAGYMAERDQARAQLTAAQAKPRKGAQAADEPPASAEAPQPEAAA